MAQVCCEVARGDKGLLSPCMRMSVTPGPGNWGQNGAGGAVGSIGRSRREAGARTNFRRFKNSKGLKGLKTSLSSHGRKEQNEGERTHTPPRPWVAVAGQVCRWRGGQESPVCGSVAAPEATYLTGAQEGCGH